MARIRTIKPEFPQSESIGRISRESRLLFIQLWTICDDEGRARGNSRMLASLLFPYDNDAPQLIDGWMAELERENCIVRYQVEGQSYVQVCNWLIHQKIDKPSRSKLPEFTESSRTFAKSREVSSEEGSRPGSLEEANASLSAKADEQVSIKIPQSIPNCPHQQIIALYAEALPELPQVKVWEGKRPRDLAARWRWVMTATRPTSGERYATTVEEGLDWFKRYFAYVSKSDFLMGRTKGGAWTASLEWLVAKGNFAKVIEGNYENQKAAA